jgi:hypothetical protein
MRFVYVVVLGFSAFVQFVFGLAFLVAPGKVLALGGVPSHASLTALTTNLGCLVLLCGALSLQALVWIRVHVPAGYRLADLLGAMLLLLN